MSPIILSLIALSAVAVLAGVAFVVMGKGGELARFDADHPPLDLPADRPLTGTDVSRVLLPLALWGYHVRAVDEVLRRVIGALGERDARIAELERRLDEAGLPLPPRGAGPGAAFAAPPGPAGPAARAGSASVAVDGAVTVEASTPPDEPADEAGAAVHCDGPSVDDDRSAGFAGDDLLAGDDPDAGIDADVAGAGEDAPDTDDASDGTPADPTPDSAPERGPEADRARPEGAPASDSRPA
ncbi:hypothetical protein LG943_01495 [Streptomonospora sp. S1-112]|uniref:Cell division protein DivIVA n=1 Tax=Streptomonospora mangrovi TaxID=2883123 RepID=A0A9X3NS02_9ACTN|nr:hypothetical protein [Streptomonospora mangrovi]MDA0563016.1 hypothetical protein [Streptomonospora mangrovi]